MSIEYAQGWDDAKAQVTTDNTQTLIAALAEIEDLKNAAVIYNRAVTDQRHEIDHLNHCISNQENVVLAQKAEIERLKAELNDAEATVAVSGAECERHIQEVDASREAIDRKDAALRVALECLEIQPQVKHIVDTITAIREALA